METLVMPFEEAVRFKESGGTQDTQFYWLVYRNRTRLWHADQITEDVWGEADIYAAPIIKTEIEV